MQAIGSAPGKIILLGEHFVVRGVPAISLSINLRAWAEVKLVDVNPNNGVSVVLSDLFGETYKCVNGGWGTPYCRVLDTLGVMRGVEAKIFSRIPPEAGLGSSTATSLALAGAACVLCKGSLDIELVMKASLEADRIFHGKPSGVDTMTSLLGGFILFRSIKNVEKIGEGAPDLRIIVVDTGIPKKTSKAVMKVLSLYERRKHIMDRVYEAAKALVEDAVNAIKHRDYVTLGELMLLNQGLLNTIGVSFPEAENIIATAMNTGALGAKITGAGLGGSVIVLAEGNKINNIVSSIKEKHRIRNYYVVSPDPQGLVVKTEKDSKRRLA